MARATHRKLKEAAIELRNFDPLADAGSGISPTGLNEQIMGP